MKIFNWLKESNRLKHLFVGALLSFAFFMLNGLLFQFCENFVLADMIVTLGVVFLAMMIVEHTQESCGGKMDYLDVLAGCLPAIIVLICVIISALVR